MSSNETQISATSSSGDNTNDLISQLITGPSIREVANLILKSELNQLYPQLAIDPELATVVTPSWKTVNGNLQPGPLAMASLTDVLIRHAATGKPVIYLDGEHFLTLTPSAATPVHLPVKIDLIGRRINLLAPLLLVAHQEQQLEYWDQPVNGQTLRWMQLSKSLQQIWKVDKVDGWDAAQLAIARQVFNYPDAELRKMQDPYKIRVCLIDMDRLDGEVSSHLNRTDLAVVIGMVGKRTIVLTHSISSGFLAYDSLEKLGAELPTYIEKLPPGTSLQWRLYEPTGNFFDHQAITLIALQVDAIGTRAFAKSVRSLDTEDTAEEHLSRFEQVRRLIPEWMNNASPVDLSYYARHLFDLTQLQLQNSGKSFDDDIPSIKTFALDALRAHMLKSHSDVADMKLEDVEIVIVSQVVWGAFTAPGMRETTRLGLDELALENLIALPLGNQSVQYKDGTAVPAWLTPEYVKAAITSVDIGKTYPERVKQKLLDDPLESRRRQGLFASNLRIQLPLQALQSKILCEHGLDDVGYRYLVAVMKVLKAERTVDGQEIVIRPLALIPSQRKNKTPDNVRNMYVIGPRNVDAGPCILYRPLMQQPLAQYPSSANLLYALKNTRELRDSVLAWLPDNVRFNYSQYVFPGQLPSVWTVSQLLSDPLIALQMSGPVLLGQEVIEHDRLATMFKANANALVIQGDRNSVSNAEYRWASFKQHAWMIFSAVLPFLGPTAGTAAWIWQILDDLQEAIEAREAQDTTTQWTALIDLFLTLGLVLAHNAVTRRHPARDVVPAPTKKPIEVEAAPHRPPPPTPSVQLPAVTTDNLPAEHQTSLQPATALNASGRSLVQLLERLKVPEPPELGTAQTDGVYQHLYQHQSKWYAKVGARWFEVFINSDQFTQIIDTRTQPPATGPLLISNAKGEWFIDVRLKLRAGMPRKRSAVQRANEIIISNIKIQIAAFDARIDAEEEAISNAEVAMNNASAETIDAARQTYLAKLEARTDEYSIMLGRLKSLTVVEEVPNYRELVIDMMETQLIYNQIWINEKYPVFSAVLDVFVKHFDGKTSDSVAPSPEDYENLSNLTHGIIQKVEFAQSRFEQLKYLGRSAAEVTNEYQGRLPTYNLDELKALQISLAGKLCVKPGESATLDSARASFGQMVNNSDITVITSLRLLRDESVLELPERIATMSDLAEQYTAIDQRIKQFTDQYPEQTVKAQVDRLQNRLDEFKEKIGSRLAELIREYREFKRLTAYSSTASASTSTSKNRVIRTRFNGTVIGETRKTAAGHPVLVDVTVPVIGKVIATFHEKGKDWVGRVSSKPAARQSDPATRITAGRTLLGSVEDFVVRTEASATNARLIPVEIEEAFHLQATGLEDAAKAIEDAISQSSTSKKHADDAQALVQQLRAQATRLTADGHRLRLEMTKRQLPTAARIEWLHGKNEVKIIREGARRRLKGARRDYLQEYAIRDTANNQVLWYAHFHYAKLEDGVMAYTAAHLKTVEQRRLGSETGISESSSNQEVTSIYRSEIGPVLARSLFFSSTPAPT